MRRDKIFRSKLNDYRVPICTDGRERKRSMPSRSSVILTVALLFCLMSRAYYSLRLYSNYLHRRAANALLRLLWRRSVD